MKRRILLADDHPILCRGLKGLLELEPDLEVVGQVGQGTDVLPAVERLRPDLLLLDLALPELGGLEALRQVRRRAPGTRVVILSMHADEAYVLEALRCGASGYVTKSAESGEVVRAIREALEGRRYLSPPLSDRAIDAYVETVETSEDPFATLTPREREVLELAARGHTAPEIADRLFIGVRTVETHRANLMRKLDLRSQTDLVRYAVRCGILPAEDR